MVVGHAGTHCTYIKKRLQSSTLVDADFPGMLVAIYLASAFVSWSWQSDPLTERFSTASHTLLPLSKLFPRTLGALGEIWSVVEATTNLLRHLRNNNR